MTTVFAAVKIDFIAMKTVIIAYEVNAHGNEDGRQRDEDGRHGKGLPDPLRPGSLYAPYSCTIPKPDPDIRLSGS